MKVGIISGQITENQALLFQDVKNKTFVIFLHKLLWRLFVLIVSNEFSVLWQVYEKVAYLLTNLGKF